MNSCVLFTILRNIYTIKLRQLKGDFFIIVRKRATLEQGESVEIRGSIVMKHVLSTATFVLKVQC